MKFDSKNATLVGEGTQTPTAKQSRDRLTRALDVIKDELPDDAVVLFLLASPKDGGAEIVGLAGGRGIDLFNLADYARNQLGAVLAKQLFQCAEVLCPVCKENMIHYHENLDAQQEMCSSCKFLLDTPLHSS